MAEAESAAKQVAAEQVAVEEVVEQTVEIEEVVDGGGTQAGPAIRAPRVR